MTKVLDEVLTAIYDVKFGQLIEVPEATAAGK